MPVLRRLLVTLAFVLLALPIGAQSPRPFRMLVTNDDGVRAPGLLAVAQALKPLGEVTIVAPAENQSAKSQSLTISDPIYVDAVELPGGLQATSLSATPATCVKVALTALLAEKPDVVVSGINRGYNLGYTAYISGTVGAAREAAMAGVPAIAASLDIRAHPNYDAAAKAVAQVAALVRQHGLQKGTFLNVNIPRDASKGLHMTTQSALYGTERFVEQRTPSNRRFFWNVYEDPKGGEDGSDVWAAAQGYVTVTPLRTGEFDQKTFDAWKGLVK